jgi:ABC-type taurine transport system substrate-binding protein
MTPQNTPTMAELLKAVTPGEWTANEPPYMAYGFKMYEVNSADHAAWTAKTQTEANALYIARLSPSTMAQVVKALELAQHEIACDYVSREFENNPAWNAVTDALALLNAQPSTRKEG